MSPLRFPCLSLPSQSVHLEYIISAANLHAYNYGLRGETDPTIFKKVADAVKVPEFTPKSNVKVQISDSDPVPQNDGGDAGKNLGFSLCLKSHTIYDRCHFNC